MATATVTLKLEPRDLHLICLALALTRQVAKSVSDNNPVVTTLFRDHLLTGLNDGDPRRIAMHATALRDQITIN